MEGLILRGIGSFYTVIAAGSGELHTLRAQKKLRKAGMTPTIGDKVSFLSAENGEEGWIEEILPRKNLLKRPSLANVDILIAVLAPVPEPDLMLMERLVLQAKRAGVEPVVCVNKTDLDTALLARMREEYRETQTPVYGVSAATGEGIPALRACIDGRIACMAGQSAVGKSSLINALTGLSLETSGVSRKTNRGRHTTRRCELIGTGEGYVADTPGFSLFELEDEILPEELAAFYEEYEKLASGCRFQPCLHDREPGCAVLNAIKQGKMSRERHERYRNLLNEARQNRRERYS